MKVLWFANTCSNYSAGSSGYNGGGWVSALECEISPRVELGVAFITREPLESPFHSDPGKKVSWAEEKRHSVTYFPIFNGYDTSRADRFTTLLKGDEKQIFDLVQSYISIVEEFRPDVIQVFGSEYSFGLIAEHTDIPVVLHLQGLVNPYFKVFLPPGATWNRYIFESLSPAKVLHRLYIRKKWLSACERESRILRNIRHFIGRTDWDRKMLGRANPEASYHEGGEIMRQPFYDADIDAISGIPSKMTLVTTISEPTYKGYDLVLKTAKLLKDKYSIPFDWKVFGNIRPHFFEKITGIRTEAAGVTLAGVATAEQLVEAIAGASMYVHPSYIDNSPNGVCEAQLLGAAVIATNVGGIPTLIKDGETGFLVRKGNPEEMAERIVAVYRNKELLRRVGHSARQVALVRHDRKLIADSLMELYRQLCATDSK